MNHATMYGIALFAVSILAWIGIEHKFHKWGLMKRDEDPYPPIVISGLVVACMVGVIWLAGRSQFGPIADEVTGLTVTWWAWTFAFAAVVAAIRGLGYCLRRLMHRAPLFIIALVVVALFGGIIYVLVNIQNRDIIARLYIKGRHELRHIEYIAGNAGQGAGSLLLRPEQSIEFYWVRQPDEIVVTALPTSRVMFVIEDTAFLTVEFTFDRDWLKKGCNPLRDDHCIVDATTKPADFMDPNDGLTGAIVRLSRQAFEYEVLASLGGASAR